MQRKRSDERLRLFDAQDEADAKKEALIAEINGRLETRVEVTEVFTIRWSVV